MKQKRQLNTLTLNSSLRFTDLELVLLDDALRDVLLQLVQYGEHGDVRLASTGRSAHEQVLVALIGSFEDERLDTVE